jgi:hypothetical protein
MAHGAGPIVKALSGYEASERERIFVAGTQRHSSARKRRDDGGKAMGHWEP